VEPRTVPPPNLIAPLTPTTTHDRGSLPIGPLSGFAVYLTVGTAVSFVPTMGPFIVAVGTACIVIAFIARTIRRDTRRNKEFAAAWWATQDLPSPRTSGSTKHTSPAGRWSE
jgi:hypothetical protein